VSGDLADLLIDGAVTGWWLYQMPDGREVRVDVDTRRPLHWTVDPRPNRTPRRPAPRPSATRLPPAPPSPEPEHAEAHAKRLQGQGGKFTSTRRGRILSVRSELLNHLIAGASAKSGHR